jgi:CRP/FNR family transcriptional regulator
MAKLEAGDPPGSPKPDASTSKSGKDLLTGDALLRGAFRESPYRTAVRDQVIVFADERVPPVLLIHDGVCYSSHAFPDGSRAIIDIVLPTDFVSLERALVGGLNYYVIAASALVYQLMPARTLRGLMADPRVAAQVVAVIGEAKWRAERHVAALTRLDARGRIAAFLLGIYDRTHRAGLVPRPRFNPHLTNDQLGDHLGMTTVHISRTLGRMRREQLAIVDRGVVLIENVERLRAIAARGPAPQDMARLGTVVAQGLSREPSSERGC